MSIHNGMYLDFCIAANRPLFKHTNVRATRCDIEPQANGPGQGIDTSINKRDEFQEEKKASRWSILFNKLKPKQHKKSK